MFLLELLFELVFGVLVEGVIELLSYAVSWVGAAVKTAFHVAWWVCTAVAIPLAAVWYDQEPTSERAVILIISCVGLPFFGIVLGRVMPPRPRESHADAARRGAGEVGSAAADGDEGACLCASRPATLSAHPQPPGERWSFCC